MFALVSAVYFHTCNYSGGDCRGEVRLARTIFWACGHWSAFARYGRLINRPCLAAPSEAVSAQADTWREAPEEGDFNRLNSYSYFMVPRLPSVA